MPRAIQVRARSLPNMGALAWEDSSASLRRKVLTQGARPAPMRAPNSRRRRCLAASTVLFPSTVRKKIDRATARTPKRSERGRRKWRRAASRRPRIWIAGQ